MSRIFAALAPWAAAIAAGVLLGHCAPVVGANARIDRVAADRDAWKVTAGKFETAALSWKAARNASEFLRAKEADTASAAANSLIEQCAARVAEARASARTIERIVTREPTYDQNRCPVRELVDPDQLRLALQPGSGAGGAARR